MPKSQCPNCDRPDPGVCPCAWCDQLGHIAQDCLAHFADSSMQARFPKKDRVKKTPIKHYECRHCGESHPFNIYCPNVRDPPIVPGKCRSCGTTLENMIMIASMWLSRITLDCTLIVRLLAIGMQIVRKGLQTMKGL